MKWSRLLGATALATLSCSAAQATEIYTYTGEPFGTGFNGTNTLPGATNITAAFLAASPLAPNKTYSLSGDGLTFLWISDGLEKITSANGTLLSTLSGPPFSDSYVQTDASGDILSWEIVELAGSGRTFVLGDQCCTIGDPPVMMTFGDYPGATACCSTDATIQTEGFFGIGPNAGYAYNNRAPGTWSVTEVPEPATWVILVAGLFGIGAFARSSRLRSES